MLLGRPISDGFGFSLNPFHYVKKAAHDIVHPLDTAKGAATAVGHAIKVGVIKPFEWVASKVTAPIRSRVHKLRDRRAGKLAWDRRKSRTPNAAEKAEAKAWTKSHLKHQGPHGEVLQLFAGVDSGFLGVAGFGAAQFGDPATISLIAASIPVFMALMNSVLKKASASGEAPADPTKGGAGGGGGGMPPGPPGAGGDAAAGGGADAAAAGGDDGSGAGGGGGGEGKLLGLPKKYVIIGGAVLGGVLVLSLLLPKKKEG